MEKKSLFEPEVYQYCLERLNKLEASTQPKWGAMSAAQMLAHCAEIQEVTNGKALEHTPFLIKLFKGFIKSFVINDKPYPKSTKTHPQYKQKVEKDFEQEKARLKSALQKFVENEAKTGSIKHPLFGSMTKSQKGWGMYKHLDHHLTQFDL